MRKMKGGKTFMSDNMIFFFCHSGEKKILYFNHSLTFLIFGNHKEQLSEENTFSNWKI